MILMKQRGDSGHNEHEQIERDSDDSFNVGPATTIANMHDRLGGLPSESSNASSNGSSNYERTTEEMYSTDGEGSNRGTNSGLSVGFVNLSDTGRANTGRKKDSLNKKFSIVDDVLMIPRSMPMLYITILGFLASFGEGALTTWSIIFFERYFPAEKGALSSVGFALFETFMGLGRYFMDYLRRKLGSRTMTKIGGILAGTGMGLVVLAPSFTGQSGNVDVAVGCLGMAICGCGLSTMIPLSFTLAGYQGHSGSSIAIAGFWQYAGSIASSPIVGAISDSIDSLRFALLFLMFMVLLIFPLGWFIPDDRYSRLNLKQGSYSSSPHHHHHHAMSSSTSKVERDNVDDEDIVTPLIV